MPRKYDSGELDFGDWTDWFATGITAVVLGIIIGGLFGWQVEKVGILRGCLAGILLFVIIGFRKQIRHFIQFFSSLKQVIRLL